MVRRMKKKAAMSQPKRQTRPVSIVSLTEEEVCARATSRRGAGLRGFRVEH
jgi:hypothetical protein